MESISSFFVPLNEATINNPYFLTGIIIGASVILFLFLFLAIIKKLTKKKVDLSSIKLGLESSAEDIRSGYKKLNEIYLAVKKIQ